MIAVVLCLAATAIDGDSIRCRNLGEVRLLGVDTADYRSSRPCREGYGDHVCNNAQAKAGKVAMKAALRMGPVRVLPVTRDRYGRLVAQVSVAGHDLSCWQLARGVARYLARYDNGGRIGGACPALTRR